MAPRDAMKAKLERRQGLRVGVVLCTMLALLLIPLRASCHLGLTGVVQAASEHHQVWHGEGKPDPCCASVNDSALVDSAVPDFASGVISGPLIALLFSGLILQASTDRPLRPVGAHPPSRSYYARSARILR